MSPAYDFATTGTLSPDPAVAKAQKAEHKKKSQRENVLKLQHSRGPIPRGRKPIAKRSKKRITGGAKAKREREAQEFARKYHSLERRAFVASLRCFATGQLATLDDPIDNAHVCDPTKTKGMGRKASYLGIVPLKRSAHRLLHDNPTRFYNTYGAFDWPAAAAWTEREWQKFVGWEAISQ